MKIVISHIYNEEFLLPYWLKHTKLFFDHGIIIDYQSTDRSLEIVKEICPTWEIRPSCINCFDARKTDQQVMDIERELYYKFPNSWRIALNTTEFLVSSDLDNDLDTNCKEAHIELYMMVDHPDCCNSELLKDTFFIDKWHGYYVPSLRLMHRKICGEYHAGRHRWNSSNDIVKLQNTIIAKFVWCPMPQILPRKLQIQHRIPQSDINLKMGWQHIITQELANQYYQEDLQRSYNLKNDLRYSEIILKFLEKYKIQ